MRLVLLLALIATSDASIWRGIVGNQRAEVPVDVHPAEIPVGNVQPPADAEALALEEGGARAARGADLYLDVASGVPEELAADFDGGVALNSARGAPQQRQRIDPMLHQGRAGVLSDPHDAVLLTREFAGLAGEEGDAIMLQQPQINDLPVEENPAQAIAPPVAGAVVEPQLAVVEPQLPQVIPDEAPPALGDQVLFPSGAEDEDDIRQGVGVVNGLLESVSGRFGLDAKKMNRIDLGADTGARPLMLALGVSGVIFLTLLTCVIRGRRRHDRSHLPLTASDLTGLNLYIPGLDKARPVKMVGLARFKKA